MNPINGYERITPTRDIRHIPDTCLPVGQSLAKRSDVHAQAGVIYCNVWPDTGHQLLLADRLSGVLHQNNEDVERAAAQLKGGTGSLQEPLRGGQPEGAK